MIQHDERYAQLDVLEDWQLEHEGQDIRGYPLVTVDGDKIGTIDDMLVDKEKELVMAVRLEDGRVTAAEPLEIHENCVVYGERAVAAAAEISATGAETEERIPLIEERVAIGKRVADDVATIRLKTKVVEDVVAEDVTLRKERVDVHRNPVDRKLTAAEADRAFQEGEVAVTARDEELVVQKDAVVTEEVVLTKDVDHATKHVEETVRKTEVDVDKSSAVAEADARVERGR